MERERDTCLVGEVMWTLLLMWWTLSFNYFNLYTCAFLGSLIVGVGQNRPINGILCLLCSSFSPSKTNKQTNKGGGCHTVALPFTLKHILRQRENYPNSNISPCKNIIFNKSSSRNQNPSRYYNSTITNLKFQLKPKLPSFKNPHITKIDLLLCT